jgi:homoserine dehydrogenase
MPFLTSRGSFRLAMIAFMKPKGFMTANKKAGGRSHSKKSSMKKYYIIHFGIGNVGRVFIEQLFANYEKIRSDFGVELFYCGMFGSKGGFFKQSGFTHAEVIKHSKHLQKSEITDPLQMLKKLPSSDLKQTIIVDSTSSSMMFPVLSLALQKGACAVLSNKKPLAGIHSEFKKLQKDGGSRFRFETTVGAGLPVIKVVKELLATGDEIIEISGCFSGTLGFLCSELEKGKTFSKTVAFAKEYGYTESDPREDLSGMDVARKAIILARLIGKEIEINDLFVTALFPDSYKKLSVSDFMESITVLDSKYEKQFSTAIKKNKTLRYIATITQQKISVGLKEVQKNSPLGSLNGPDNMIVIKTRRYFAHPMVIQGPGAGLEVTAAGVFGDILSLVAL